MDRQAALFPEASTLFLIWNPPDIVLGEQLHLFLYLLVMTVFVRTCITLFEVPNAAQGPELTNDYDDRTRLQAYRYLFGWLGGLSIAVVAFMVLFALDPAGQLGPTGYRWIGVVGATAMIIATLVSALGTHRHIPDFYQPPAGVRYDARSVLLQFQSLFRQRSFVAVFTSSLFFGAAAGLNTALTIYVNTFFWHLSTTEIGYIPLLGIIAVPASFFLAPRLAERLGKRQ